MNPNYKYFIGIDPTSPDSKDYTVFRDMVWEDRVFTLTWLEQILAQPTPPPQKHVIEKQIRFANPDKLNGKYKIDGKSGYEICYVGRSLIISEDNWTWELRYTDLAVFGQMTSPQSLVGELTVFTELNSWGKVVIHRNTETVNRIDTVGIEVLRDMEYVKTMILGIPKLR